MLQLAVLVPYLRSVGYRFRPRVDFRDAGLGHTLRLGVWTLLFVLVNQVAYAVVVRLASSGPAETLGNEPGATGYLVYSATFLIVMVPHSVVTVSLATAVLPRMSALAAEGDHAELARTLVLALRNALVVIVPFALLLPLVSLRRRPGDLGLRRRQRQLRQLRALARRCSGSAWCSSPSTT